MPDLRPVIEQEQVLTLLHRHFTEPITHLVPVEGGQLARTFAFHTGEQDYILRFNPADHLPISFAKEAYLSQTIASPLIPIPRVTVEGRWQNLYFAISERVPGRMVEKLPVQEVIQLVPSLMATLFAIHQLDVRQQKNYGVFDEQGVAHSPDWRSFLVQVKEEEEEWDYFGKWHHMFEDTFLERDLFDAIFQRMVDLLDFCPAGRYLVHGNYSLRNILAHEGKITGVVDWLDARYGDFVYDIAGLDFWILELRMRERCQHYYEQRLGAIPFYEERVLCYECYIALIAMRFFAKKGDEGGYGWTRGRILRLLPYTA
jgi:hygromycin-B 4-O-kinase